MVEKRLAGVTIIGSIELLFGLTVGYVFVGNLFLGLNNNLFSDISFSKIKTIMFLMKSLILFIVCVTSGVGILRLKSWARKMNIFFIPLLILYRQYSLNLWRSGLQPTGHGNIFDGIHSYFYHEFINLRHSWVYNYALIALMFFVPVVFYLTRPKVKALFSPERGEAESKEAV